RFVVAVEKLWQIHSLLMDVVPISGKHTGENLCGTFMKACDDLGVLHKLLAITTDNATNNNTFLRSLEEKCRGWGISFDRKSRHVRCMAHIINLAVNDFLDKLNSSPKESEDAYDERYIPDAQSAGFMPRLRKLVVEVRSSVQHLEQFADRCKHDEIR